LETANACSAPLPPISPTIRRLLSRFPCSKVAKRSRCRIVTFIMTSSSADEAASPPHTDAKTSNHIYTDTNIGNFAPVARIMKSALPDNAKIAKEAKECMQECVSEFISFITSEGKLHIPNQLHDFILTFDSIRKVSTREEKDCQWRRYSFRDDISGIRELFRGTQDLSSSLSRGKHSRSPWHIDKFLASPKQFLPYYPHGYTAFQC
jgi:hypothetical protein